MKTLHAEIAGGGITGLAAAASLAQQGWTVRVHESSPELREIGSGIFLKENSIRVLEAIGAFNRIRRSAVRLLEGKVFDEKQRLLLHRNTGSERSYACLRQELHRALSEAAVFHGAEIVTDSPVEGATPEGELILVGGRRCKADLVVGADGYQSRVRDSLGLTKRLRILTSGATRLLVGRSEGELAPMQQEHWSHRCRLGFAPCSDEEVYVFLVSPESDATASNVPIDKAFWTRMFPHKQELIERIPEGVGNHAPFALVDVKSWRAGRTVLMGDAAHAQPPNLGQGAGLGMANAFALAQELACIADMDEAIARWEAEKRPLSEEVKTWSHRYGLLASHWPEHSLGVRSALIWMLGHNGTTQRKWAWLWRGGISARSRS